MAVGCRALSLSLLAGLLGLALASAPADKDKSVAKTDQENGRKIYKTHCAICHFAGSSFDKVGPGMKGLFKLKKLPGSGLPVTEKNVRSIIERGTGDPQMTPMPPFRDRLSPKEKDDLIAYLKTL
ncbi:MAG: c-type cytochrome [Terriglobia bacterium]